MKKVEAFIRARALGEAKTRLRSLGISGATVGEVDTVLPARALPGPSGASASARQRRRGAAAPAGATASGATLRLEIVVKNAMVRGVVRALIEASRTAGDRDGRIFVNEVEDAFRIRTSERGTDAISP